MPFTAEMDIKSSGSSYEWHYNSFKNNFNKQTKTRQSVNHGTIIISSNINHKCKSPSFFIRG